MDELKKKIKRMSELRKLKYTQEEISKMTGVSRSHISNFEQGRVNNMYLYDFYINMFEKGEK